MPTITVTIDLPDDYTFESRGETFGPFDLAALPPVSIANLAIHGAKQKLADNNSAENKADGVTKTWATLQSGAWRAERSAGKPALSPLDSIIWDLMKRNVMDKVKAKLGVKTDKQLTADHRKRVDELTKEYFANETKRAEYVPAAQKALDAREATKSLAADDIDFEL